MSDFTPEPEFNLPADTAVDLDVRADVIDGLAAWFEPNVDGFKLRNELHAHGNIANERITAVAWRYEAHPRETVWGVAARRPIMIDGATFVDNAGTDDPADQQFSRYIDWHGVFNQLGVSAAGRVVSDSIDS